MARNPKKSGKSLSAGENFAHPLYQLIGAPLLALIQAESQAAQATAAFIEEIGFESTDSKDDSRTEGESDKQSNSLGAMKMAKFSNHMQGPDGTINKMDIEVPVLSLVPIPALQIKDAELEFYVKILDFSKSQKTSRLNKNKQVTAEGADDHDFLSQNQMQLRASMGRGPSTNQQQSSMESQVRIKINMTQADIPVGLSKLFNIMDQSITTKPARKDEE